jgi:hypothetical protein
LSAAAPVPSTVAWHFVPDTVAWIPLTSNA